jgi:hypothetical protein
MKPRKLKGGINKRYLNFNLFIVDPVDAETGQADSHDNTQQEN